METILDVDQNNIQQEYRYAGFWIRFVAAIIDGIIMWVPGYIIDMLPLGFISNSGFSFLIGICYHVLMNASANQGTLGKMALGIKIINSAGERITAGQAVGRYFAEFISAIILCTGFMMAGWDSKKQALHDKMANTYVIYK